MTCADVRDLLGGYADGELDLVRGLDVERHLQGCPDCGRAFEGLRALQEALRTDALRFTPPPGLRQRVRASLPDAGRDAPGPRRGGVSPAWRWLAVAATLALVTVTAWSTVRLRSLPSPEDVLAQEVVDDHLRSLLADHLLDVKSSDQHTVKPWFHGKLSFAPPVPQLGAEGFELLGGRLDTLGGREVAALVYRRRQHTINLLIGPAGRGGGAGETESTRQGYHLVAWSRGDLAYWAVSDLNPAELREFVRLVQQHSTPAK